MRFSLKHSTSCRLEFLRGILLSLSVVVGSGLLGETGCAAAGSPLKPGDIEVSVALDETPVFAMPSERVTATASITLTRKTSTPVNGVIRIGGPADQAEPRAAFQELGFDLMKTNSAAVHARLTVPPMERNGRVVYPVNIVVGSENYVTMDVRVTRGPAWHLIGPFEGGPDTAHNAVFPPEQGIDLAATHPGKGGASVRWQRFPATAQQENGFFNLDEALGKPDEATAYAFCEVLAMDDMPARLALGSDDSIKVWHNGKLVHDKVVTRSAEPGQDIVNVTLTKGTNTFLVKVCDGGGDWGFFFDIQNRDGAPLQNLRQWTGISQVTITDPVLRLTEATRTSASLRWESDVPNVPRVIVRKALQGRALPVWGDVPKSEMVKSDPAAAPIIIQTTDYTTRHKATVTGLQPGTRYLVSVDPACGGTESERLSFYTASPEGLTQFLKLRLICIIFSNVTRDDSLTAPGAREPAPASEIEKIKWEMRQTQLFYWVNSGMRLDLEVDYIVDDRFYAIDDAVYAIGYSGKDEAALEELLPRNGHKVSDYDGRIFISIVKQWDPNARSGAGAWHYPFGGGGTIGPEEYPGYGKSAWRGGSTSNSAWLFCHEFQHQLDALYHWSMGPEHLFNHFQPWDDTAHRHGEHWDGNGWIFWEWAGYVTRDHQWYPLLEPKLGFRYFTCRWGEVIQTTDADNDGIPDDAPEVPLDEKRFGSDPTKVDTDNDGLSDMMEVMACRWLEFGLDEIWGGDKRAHYCNPRDPDSDKDGVLDGADPYPVYPVNPLVKKADNPSGPIPQTSFRPFVKFRDFAYEADFRLAWNDDYFVIEMSARTPPANMRIYLDANDNGWYVGGDNYDLRLHPNGDAPAGGEWHANAKKTFAVAFHNCSVKGKWPFYDPDWQPDSGFDAVETKTRAKYSVEIRIPKNPSRGLDLREGKKIGILIAINPEGGNGRPNEHGALTVFEPHTFFTVELGN